MPINDPEHSTAQTPNEATLEELTRQRDEYLEGWRRAKADFANYKKEESERLSRIGELSTTRVARDFLSVLDTIERAETHLSLTDTTDTLRAGFALVAKQIRDVLSSHEIREIEALGTFFDPEIHEAVGERPQEGVPPGTVLDVAEKGYVMRDKLLRPAKVIIAA